LSKYLRHRPEELGLELEPGGWVAVDELLAAFAHRGFPISREQLEKVVARNDKKRLAFDESSTRVRVQQGHTVPVDLGLEPVEPTLLLYHGTLEGNLPEIMCDGLKKMRRHHVHLSLDKASAALVGARRGRPCWP
jgi:putative RNA 2'-phosphotransferase